MLDVKWIIFVVLVAVVGSLMASFMDGASGSHSTNMLDVIDDLEKVFDSLKTISWKNIGNIIYQGGQTIVDLAKAMINMFICNYEFLDGYDWIRYILIAFNAGILLWFIFEVNRALKPFGG